MENYKNTLKDNKKMYRVFKKKTSKIGDIYDLISAYPEYRDLLKAYDSSGLKLEEIKKKLFMALMAAKNAEETQKRSKK